MFGIHATDANTAMASGLEGHIAATSDGAERWSFDKIDAGDDPTRSIRCTR
jgi:hypothetical protein